MGGVILRVAANAPQTTCYEFLLVFLISLCATPGRLLTVRSNFEEQRAGE